MLYPIVGDRRCYLAVVLLVMAEVGRGDGGGGSSGGGGGGEELGGGGG